MEYSKLISERFSVRNFKDMPVDKTIVDEIIKAGHIAPTGCNFQPQRILVISSGEALAKLKKCTRCHFNAPLAFLVCANMDESWTRPYDGAKSAPVDAAIVSTHMMLAAYDSGVGSCWVMHFNPHTMREEFSIPSNYEPVALLVMGYPADDAKPLDMHSKYRPIEDVVFYDSF